MLFFAQEAQQRLEDNRVARRLARATVRRWRIPGTRYADPAVVAEQVGQIFGTPVVVGAMEAADRTVQTWPGLDGMRPARAGADRLRG